MKKGWLKALIIFSVMLLWAISFGSHHKKTLHLAKKENKPATPAPIVNPAPVTVITNPPVEIDFNQLAKNLHQEASNLNPAVIDKAVLALKCADKSHIENKNLLTIIDYSLPSNQKRLWVFDLINNKLLFQSYVSHGLMSGALVSDFFSNKNNSKASSLGVYQIEKSYQGRHGLSVRLDGLDNGFNANANSRYVVIHGAWYVNEDFIKKYGRPGRSWGCPAVPNTLSLPILSALQEKSLLIAYYPDELWLEKSKFLNCENPKKTISASLNKVAKNTIQKLANQTNEKIIFADLQHDNKRKEKDPVVVMSADYYTQIFKMPAPLERMLRRQINNREYVALNDNDLAKIINLSDPNILNNLYFVVAEVKWARGHYATEMKIVNLGKIKSITLEQPTQFSVSFENNLKTLPLKITQQFIRWVGL